MAQKFDPDAFLSGFDPDAFLASVPTQPGSGKPPTDAPLPGLGTKLSLKQGIAPDDAQFINYLTSQGFQDQGNGVVIGPDGKAYDIFSRDDLLLRNFPEIALTGLAAASGVGMGGRLAGPGVLRWLGRVLGTSAIEGGLNAGGEVGRQALGISQGVGSEFNPEKIEMSGKAGATAGALPGMMGGLMEGTAKFGKALSGLPDDIAQAVRMRPELLDRSGGEAIQASERAFNERLQSQGTKLIGDSAKAKQEALARAEEAGVSVDPQEVFRAIEDAGSDVYRPFGAPDPLAAAKAELSQRLPKTQGLPILNSQGLPIQVEMPGQVVSPEELAAFKAYLQDLGAPTPLERSSFKESLSRKASKGVRELEDSTLDIEGQIARDRLANINRLREQYPTMSKGLTATAERKSKDHMFKPSIDDSMEESLRQLDELGVDDEMSPLMPEFQDIMMRKRVGQANKIRSSETGSSLYGPLVGGALGTALSPGMGTAMGTAIGAGVQSPAANLQLQKLLGYLDRLGARKGAKVGAGLRDTVLMEMIEGE